MKLLILIACFGVSLMYAAQVEVTADKFFADEKKQISILTEPVMIRKKIKIYVNNIVNNFLFMLKVFLLTVLLLLYILIIGICAGGIF